MNIIDNQLSTVYSRDHPASVVVDTSSSTIQVTEVSLAPESLSHSTGTGPGTRQEVSAVHILRPHTRLPTHNKGLLSSRPIERQRVTGIDLNAYMVKYMHRINS